MNVVFMLLFALLNTGAHAAVAPAIPANDSFFVQTAKANELKIMSYNAFNLFDAVHDEGYFDYTFLPKGYPGKATECEAVKSEYYKKECLEIDWTPAKVPVKIKQIVKVLKSHGSKPDIVTLQEVENASVTAMLAKAAGYSHHLITEYKSNRGIDVAVLYDGKKLTMEEEFHVPTPGRDPYRLRFKFKPTGAIFFVYVNHWLAQSAPKEYRLETAKALRADIDAIHAAYKDARIIALGDFNVKPDEEEEVLNQILLTPSWGNQLVDVHTTVRAKYPDHAKKYPNGSYFYPTKKSKDWRRFDRFMVSKAFMSAKAPSVKLDTYRVVYSSFLTGTGTFNIDEENHALGQLAVRYPLEYNFHDDPEMPLGFSDHLPISIILGF